MALGARTIAWLEFGLGIGVSYAYSVVALLVPSIFPLWLRGGAGVVAVYFEAAAVIVALVFLGLVLELGARSDRLIGATLNGTGSMVTRTERIGSRHTDARAGARVVTAKATPMAQVSKRDGPAERDQSA